MFNIETLAVLTGLSRRTIRYYVQRGLLAPPQGGGRGSYYTEKHLEELKRIQKWSDQGVPLVHMKAMQDGRTNPIQVDTQTGLQTIPFERCRLDDGIELTFRPGRLSNQDLLKTQAFIKELLRRKSDNAN